MFKKFVGSKFVKAIIIDLDAGLVILLEFEEPFSHGWSPETILGFLRIEYLRVKLVILLECKW